MASSFNLTQRLIRDHIAAWEGAKVDGAHLPESRLTPGSEIGIRIDQTLTQDATGTLVMLELEAMGLERVKTALSVQYVDHNLLQTDHKNADDHVFLLSACKRFGIWYSRPGNGVSHPVHMERFGVPGASLAGSDSHTPAAGALGMLAFGSGGMDVAFAMAGEPLFLAMPRVLGVEVVGKLPPWVSAKDAILELLRRHGVEGCKGWVVEYSGPGLAGLSTMDRHVMANMGTEMGATTSVFPSDQETWRFLKAQGREEAWRPLAADPGAAYDAREILDLSALEPLIAFPGSPGDVHPVREAAGLPIYQSYIGSSANPGLRDFWVAAEIVSGRMAHPEVSLDINPSSRQTLENLIANGSLEKLVRAGARIHQAGCNGCIGMGQAPASGRASLRTVPRNFPGRSGSVDDRVYLCSPETAAASALTGEITDPRDLEALGLAYPRYQAPGKEIINTAMLLPPDPETVGTATLIKGPNIKALPDLGPLPDAFRVPVLLKLGDDISTDEILRAGAEALPYRSNIPEIARFTYGVIDPGFPDRAIEAGRAFGGHVVVAGRNYAQGSSREHAALAPRYLGQIAVLAKGFARIGRQNLVNFGILPLEFRNPDDYQTIRSGDLLSAKDLRSQLMAGGPIRILNETRGLEYPMAISLSERQMQAVLAGGVISYFRIHTGGAAEENVPSSR
ncbi:MAG: aconitate hydratase [Fibrobacteres bacterium]|nr:aconitate hydratase [Fibrobacterota bacterium]